MSFEIHNGPVNPAALQRQLEDPACGGVVWFEGRVRNRNDGRPVERLEYEVYRPLALREGRRILEEARQRWPLGQAGCAHSEGLLELGEVAVLVGVASAHRAEAFEACRFAIDTLKVTVPIWKREVATDGAYWVDDHA